MGRRNKRKKARALALLWTEELKEQLGLSHFEGALRVLWGASSSGQMALDARRIRATGEEVQ